VLFFAAARNVPPDGRAAAVLLQRQRDADGDDRMKAAKARLERREREAAERKAKYATVGMANIAAAMVKRGDGK
jgi:hypothetical protein